MYVFYYFILFYFRRKQAVVFVWWEGKTVPFCYSVDVCFAQWMREKIIMQKKRKKQRERQGARERDREDNGGKRALRYFWCWTKLFHQDVSFWYSCVLTKIIAFAFLGFTRLEGLKPLDNIFYLFFSPEQRWWPKLYHLL